MTVRSNNGGVRTGDVFCRVKQRRDEAEAEESSAHQIVQLKGRLERSWETAS